MVNAGTHVIKRAGHSEPFDESKLYDSIRRACLSVRSLEGEAELFATRVTLALGRWAEEKAEITSRELRVRASSLLAILHSDAAYAYDTLDSTL